MRRLGRYTPINGPVKAEHRPVDLLNLPAHLLREAGPPLWILMAEDNRVNSQHGAVRAHLILNPAGFRQRDHER